MADDPIYRINELLAAVQIGQVEAWEAFTLLTDPINALVEKRTRAIGEAIAQRIEANAGPIVDGVHAGVQSWPGPQAEAYGLAVEEAAQVAREYGSGSG